MRRLPLPLPFIVGIVLLVAGTGRLFAHHSFAATYNSDTQIEVTGTVIELVWRNPHSFLRLDVPDEDGNIETWALEWGSINQLAEENLTRTTLRPGDLVIARGDAPRNSSYPRLLLLELTRPADGWHWVGRVR